MVFLQKGVCFGAIIKLCFALRPHEFLTEAQRSEKDGWNIGLLFLPNDEKGLHVY
jgi:hypothetical protein